MGNISIVLRLIYQLLFNYFDVVTDILVIKRNYETEKYTYFILLIISMVWNRVFNFFYNVRFFGLICGNNRLSPETKNIKKFTLSTILLGLLSTITQTDFLIIVISALFNLERQKKQHKFYDDYESGILNRKQIADGITESIISLFITSHQLYSEKDSDDDKIMLYISLIAGIISLVSSDLEYLKHSFYIRQAKTPFIEQIYYIIIILAELVLKLFFFSFLANETGNIFLYYYVPSIAFIGIFVNLIVQTCVISQKSRNPQIQQYLTRNQLPNNENQNSFQNNDQKGNNHKKKKSRNQIISYFTNAYRSVFYFRAEPFKYSILNYDQVEDNAFTLIYLFGPQTFLWPLLRYLDYLFLCGISFFFYYDEEKEYVFAAFVVMCSLWLIFIWENTNNYIVNCLRFNQQNNKYECGLRCGRQSQSILNKNQLQYQQNKNDMQQQYRV